MQGILIEILKQVVIRQTLKWRKDLDFTLWRKDILERVAHIVPGDEWDAKAQLIVNVFLDIVEPLIKMLPGDAPKQQIAAAANTAAGRVFEGVLEIAARGK